METLKLLLRDPFTSSENGALWLDGWGDKKENYNVNFLEIMKEKNINIILDREQKQM